MSKPIVHRLEAESLADYFDMLISSMMALMPESSRLSAREFWILRELLVMKCEGENLVGVRKVSTKLNGHISYESLRHCKIALTQKGFLIKTTGEFIFPEKLNGCGADVSISLKCPSCNG